MSKIKNWLKKYFVPHDKNNYEPHFLRHESITMLFLAVIVIELGFLVQVFVVFDKTSFLASVLPGVLTSLTNEERAQNNAAPLKENALLSRAAQLKAEDMASKGYFAHTSPEGKTPWYWFDQVGYRYVSAGENLAVNFFDSSDVAEAWMNSPTHRENIVKQSYKEIGIGVANGVYKGKNTVFVAQLFGTPIASAAKVAPTNNVTPTTTPKTAPTTTPVVKPKPTTTTPKPTPTTTPKVLPTAPTNIPTGVAVVPAATQVLGEESTKDTPSFQNAVIDPIKISIEKILASPRQSVAYTYGIVAALTLFSLFLVMFVASEIKHFYFMLRGLGLVSVIIYLFINIKIIHKKLPSHLEIFHLALLRNNIIFLYNAGMRKARLLLVISLWLAILPFLGFPYSWKGYLTILTGFGLMYFSYALYKESKEQSKATKQQEEMNFDNFRENNFSQEVTEEN